MATISFGMLTYVDNDDLFYGLALFIRILQGVGDAGVNCSVFSTIAQEFPQQKTEYLGYAEVAIGLGMMGGPVLGQAFYSLFGFAGCFYALSVVLTASLIVAYIFIPKSVNHSIDYEGNQSEERTVNSANEIKVSYWTILRNKEVIIISVSSVVACTCMNFSETIYSDQLIFLGISEHLVGYFFALTCLAYVAACPLVNICSKYVPSRLYLTFGAFMLCFVFDLIQGPSLFLNFPESVAMTVIGFTFEGAIIAFIFVPLLSIIIEAVQRKENLGENEDLNDKSAGIFSICYALGCVLAPLIGGALSDRFGFRKTCDIMAAFTLAYGILFFFVALLPDVTKRCKRKLRSRTVRESRTQFQIKLDQAPLQDEKKINLIQGDNSIFSDNRPREYSTFDQSLEGSD